MENNNLKNIVNLAKEGNKEAMEKLVNVPPKARLVLKRFDDLSQHYEIRENLEY